MSKKLFFLPALLLGAFLIFGPGCGSSDPCKDVKCGANGTCFEGSCVCNEGYEGTSCADEWSAKFVASFDGVDDCTVPPPAAQYSYPLSITRVSASKILLLKLGGTVYDVEATVKKANASDVSAQSITIDYTSGGRTFKGSGVLSGSKVTGDYEISAGGVVTDKCTFSWTKK